MTALGLIALWALDSLTSPPLPDELGAVARLRLDAVARLPVVERDELMRLFRTDQPHPVAAAIARQEGNKTTWH